MDDRKWTFRKVLKVFIVAGVLGTVGTGLYGGYIYMQTQQIEDPKKCFTTTMFKVKLCPSSPNYVTYKNVPEIFFRTLILSEDASFWIHKGFDWFEIKESFKRNLEDWSFARGGSTLTQQLAKNLYLSQEKSLSRKFKEVFIAKQIEEHLTKSQILEKYVNVVEFGKNIYGLKRAAAHYFDKAPSELNVLESVYLVSLLPSPIRYSQSFHNKKLSRSNISRMKVILRRLYLTKRISTEEYAFTETLIDTEDWPFPSYSPNQYFFDEEQLAIEDELIEELNESGSESETGTETDTQASEESPLPIEEEALPEEPSEVEAIGPSGDAEFEEAAANEVDPSEQRKLSEDLPPLSNPTSDEYQDLPNKEESSEPEADYP